MSKRQQAINGTISREARSNVTDHSSPKWQASAQKNTEADFDRLMDTLVEPLQHIDFDHLSDVDLDALSAEGKNLISQDFIQRMCEMVDKMISEGSVKEQKKANLYHLKTG